MLISYFSLRLAIGAFAFALPVLVSLIGWLHGYGLQTSISAYYLLGETRDVFVAILCAIGVFLLTYDGYNTSEKITNTVMGLAAFGVAMCPTASSSTVDYSYGWLIGFVHVFFAVVVFVGMALLALYFFPTFQSRTPLTPQHEAINAFWYRVFGAVIASSLVFFGLRYLYFAVIQHQKLPLDATLFWVEWISIWAFSGAWLVKSHAFAPLIKKGLRIEAF